MNRPLTIAYITAREDPHIEWFLQSLRPQINEDDNLSVLIVDALADERGLKTWNTITDADWHFQHTLPKPTVWQGKFRITKDNWWAASNARNTALLLAETEWIAFLDDRCVLMPGWLAAIRRAMHFGYAVCGTYEKRVNMTVKDGVIVHGGTIIGEDTRVGSDNGVVRAPGEWFFGCTNALPLDWALAVNGYDETCDGLSMEDVIFGLMLQNNGYPICYDRRMKIVEDRTPEQIGKPMRREDKGVSPKDKSHTMLAMLRDLKRAMHQWDLREIKKSLSEGHEFPIPKEPTNDWYDGQPLSEM